MRHAFFVLLPVLLAFSVAISTAPAFAENITLCKEGERRVCGLETGICEGGRSICESGNWTDCQGGTAPRLTEICGNGIDDDCDGAIDENCFPWLSFVLVGIGIFFIGVGMYYIQKDKSGRLASVGVSKD